MGEQARPQAVAQGVGDRQPGAARPPGDVEQVATDLVRGQDLAGRGEPVAAQRLQREVRPLQLRLQRHRVGPLCHRDVVAPRPRPGDHVGQLQSGLDQLDEDGR